MIELNLELNTPKEKGYCFKFEMDDGRTFEFQNCASFSYALTLLEGELGGRDQAGNLPAGKGCERVYVNGELAQKGDNRKLKDL